MSGLFLAPLAVALEIASSPTTACAEHAADLVLRAERLPMHARAAAILEALRMDAVLGCETVGVEHWTRPPELPAGCSLVGMAACRFPGGLAVSRSLVRDVDPSLYARVQTAASALAKRGLLGPAHERLFKVLLLSAAAGR